MPQLSDKQRKVVIQALATCNWRLVSPPAQLDPLEFEEPVNHRKVICRRGRFKLESAQNILRARGWFPVTGPLTGTYYASRNGDVAQFDIIDSNEHANSDPMVESFLLAVQVTNALP